MHDPTAEGPAFFKCDFCRAPWTDDNPMVEGHQGSLICARCLTVAYVDIVHSGAPAMPDGGACTMCLEERKDACWRSPVYEDAVICRRCVKQSSTVLEKDDEFTWTRPQAQT